MNDKEIREMLNVMGYGENPPEELFRFIVEYRRRKSVMFPSPLRGEEVAMITMMYEVFVGARKRVEKEKKPNG